MLESARILGGVSAVLLIVAVAAWVSLIRRPALQRLDGRVVPDSGRAETASRLLMLAVGTSAIAAVFAIAG